jgi:hypothetical protein
MPPKSSEQITHALVRLLVHYGIAVSDEQSLQKVLMYALRDGRVRLPPKHRVPRKRGAPPKWTAELGFELVDAIEHIRMEQMRREAAKTRKPLGSLKEMKVTTAIKVLQTRFPEKWGDYHPDELRKRYYDARRVWGYARRLFAKFKLSGK